MAKPCADCGESFKLGYCNDYCRKCRFKHGTIWILDMSTWEWTQVEYD